jgi:methylenetetrahydrofolate dehydrogenase (NADP+)/methenyltetrahydrofolate cyclohydrolase
LQRIDRIRIRYFFLTMPTGTASILDGSRIASQIMQEVAEKVRHLTLAGHQPGLAVIVSGADPASQVYVRSKLKACDELGIKSEKIAPADSASTEDLLELVESLNQRDDVDAILVQLPLPAHVDAKKLLLAVAPEKDVDCFHPVNIGNLITQRPGLAPCTPAGIIELLRRRNIEISGQHAVVVGRSDIVGRPMAILLLNHHATVTICHSRTRDLAMVTRLGDILVVAMGRAAAITKEFVKPGATVIDVGINRITDSRHFNELFAGDAAREKTFREKGSVLVGDVHPRVADVAGAITPVPGGVGLLTVAMLMANTVAAAQMRLEKQRLHSKPNLKAKPRLGRT